MLVNNGGGPGRGIALGLDPAAVEIAVELLLLPVVRLTNLCLPYLEQSGRGRIVNIESSSVREPLDGLVLSNTVRPGVIGWAKTLAREVAAKGITVNTIAPGRIDTERLAEGFSDETAREEARGAGPGPPFRQPGGDRERRLLPRLRPGELRDRRRRAGRRRPDPVAALSDRPTRGVLGGLVLAGIIPVAIALFVLWIVPSTSTCSSPTRRTPPPRPCRCRRRRRSRTGTAAGSTTST